MMTSQSAPELSQLQEWLDLAGMEHYQCGHCEGVHLRALQDTTGVIDSRLFVEDYGLLLTTELEVRPGALLQVSADLGRLNMDYPILKVFLDVVDDAMPQLVVASTCHIAAGLSQDQFRHFVLTAVEATGQLALGCGHLNYLFGGAEPGATLLH